MNVCDRDHKPRGTARIGRQFLGGLAAAWLASLPVVSHAQDYPTRPVRIVVAFTAGGTTDMLARSVGQQLSERLKQPFVIDNKPGAGGNIGTEMVVRSAPDGYTLIIDSVGPIAVNPTLYKGLSYNPLTDLVPIVQIADVPNVLVVPGDALATANNVRDSAALLRLGMAGEIFCSTVVIFAVLAFFVGSGLMDSYLERF